MIFPFRKLLRRISWQESILVIFILIILAPSLWISWMIVDDGVSILNANMISSYLSNLDFQGLLNLFIEKESGRFRPGYWIFYWLSTLVVGGSSVGHHFIHFFIITLTVYFLFLIINTLTLSKTTALVGSLLFLLSSLNVENWYRLGPQEPLMTFCIAISTLYFIQLGIKKKKVIYDSKYILLVVLPIIFGFFIKETFVAFFPFALYLFIGYFFVNWDKSEKVSIYNKKNFHLPAISHFLGINIALLLLAILLYVFVKSQGHYSSYYSFSILTSIGNAQSYVQSIISSLGILFWVLSSSFLFGVFRAFRQQKFTPQLYLQIAFLVGGISFLAIQLPWSFVMSRYLEPVIFFLVVFWSFEIARFLKYFSQFSKINVDLRILNIDTMFAVKMSSVLAGLVCLYFFLLVYSNSLQNFNYVVDAIVGTRNISKTLQLAAMNITDNNKVYMNLKKGDATIELVFESGLHLNLFYNKPNLKVEYLDKNSVANLKQGDVIITAIASSPYYAYREEEIKSFAKIKTIATINNNVPNLSFLIPPGTLLKKAVFLRGLSEKEVLFKYAITKNEWKVYQVL